MENQVSIVSAPFDNAASRRALLKLFGVGGAMAALGGHIWTGGDARSSESSDRTCIYDLAWFDTNGMATFGGHTRESSTIHFTAGSALAAGFVGEQGSAALFADGLQVLNSFNRLIADDIGVRSFISQHYTAEGADAWLNYARPQLWPDEAETFPDEDGNADERHLARFQFPSTQQPGMTVTRLTGIQRSGIFNHWFIVDGIGVEPDLNAVQRYQQAITDAIAPPPGELGSLAPYVLLPAGSFACFDAFAGQASDGLSGVRALQEVSDDCYPRTLDVNYIVQDGTVRHRTGQPDAVVDLTNQFFDAARDALEVTYTYSIDLATGEPTNVITGISITRWDDPSVLENNGEEIIVRTGAFDLARSAVREPIVFERAPPDYRPLHPQLPDPPELRMEMEPEDDTLRGSFLFFWPNSGEIDPDNPPVAFEIRPYTAEEEIPPDDLFIPWDESIPIDPDNPPVMFELRPLEEGVPLIDSLSEGLTDPDAPIVVEIRPVPPEEEPSPDGVFVLPLPDGYEIDPDNPPVIFEVWLHMPDDAEATPVAPTDIEATPEPPADFAATPAAFSDDTEPISFQQAWAEEVALNIQPRTSVFTFPTSPDTAIYGISALYVADLWSIEVNYLSQGPSYDPNRGFSPEVFQALLEAVTPDLRDWAHAARLIRTGRRVAASWGAEFCGDCTGLKPAFGKYYEVIGKKLDEA